MMLGRLANCLVEPCGPLLRADSHKAVLDALDPPLLVERQDLIKLALQRPAIDIQYDPDVALFCIFDDGVQIERTLGALRIDRDGPGVGFVRIFMPVPAGVEFDILQPASNSTYCRLCSAAKSTHAIPPAVVRVTSRITLPGLIHDVSAIAQGSFRFRIR
jgi:hypothetical protein